LIGAAVVVVAVPVVTVRWVLSAPIIARLGEASGESPIRPMSEATPQTLEPVG
jgi:hypothetical protein